MKMKVTRAVMEAWIQKADGDDVAMKRVARLVVGLALAGNIDAIDLVVDTIDGPVGEVGDATE